MFLLLLLLVEIQPVSDPLTARGAEQARVRRPVGQAGRDISQLGLGETQAAVFGLLLHTELDVAALQGQKRDVDINQTGANDGALV